MVPDPLYVASVAETVRSSLRNTDDPDEFRRYLYELKDILYEAEFEGDLDDQLHDNLTEHVAWLSEEGAGSLSEHHRSSIIDDVHRVKRFCQRRGRGEISSTPQIDSLPESSSRSDNGASTATDGDDGDSAADNDASAPESMSSQSNDSASDQDASGADSQSPSVDDSSDDDDLKADPWSILGLDESSPPDDGVDSASDPSNEIADTAGQTVQPGNEWVEDEPADPDFTPSDDSMATTAIGTDRPDWLDVDPVAAIDSWRDVKWPYAQPPVTRTGYLPKATIPDDVTATAKFTVADPEYLSMVLDEETVYVAAGGLYAYDRETGIQEWSLPRPKTKRHYGRPLLERDGVTLWVGAAGRTVEKDVTLRCIDTETGDITDTIDVGSGIESSPVQADEGFSGDDVIIGVNDGSVRGYSTFTKMNDWTVYTEGAVYHSPAIDEGLGVVGDYDGTVVAFDIDDGTVQWERSYGEGTARPTIGNGTVFIPIDDKIIALDLETGRRKYELPKGGRPTPSPAFAHNTLFVPGTLFDPNLHAYDVSDAASAGEERYRVNVTPKADPLVFGETLIVGGLGGIYAYNVRDGSEIWQYETDEKCTTLAAAPERGSTAAEDISYVLYAGLDDGRVLNITKKPW